MTDALWEILKQGVIETLQMTIISAVLAYLIGLPYGVFLKVTEKGGILQNRPVHAIMAIAANICRSVPFMILLVYLIPFTRMVVGTSLGTEAAIVPLTVGTIPIVARMVQTSLDEIPAGTIEAAKAMGASPYQIIVHFMLPEATPSLVSGVAINMTTILGYSAMAGCIGGGGLGAIALNYGYYRYMKDVLRVTVVILIIIVQILQEGGNLISRKIRRT